MTRDTVQVRLAIGPVAAKALPTPIPGLALTEVPNNPPDARFTLTHQRSGLSVASAESPEQIARIAPAFAGFDWTRSGDEIRQDPEFRVRLPEWRRLDPNARPAATAGDLT